MSPEAKQIFQGILKRDTSLTEWEQSALRSILVGQELLQPVLPAIQRPVALSQPLLTRAQVAEHLNVSVSTVERLEKAGQLKPITITTDCPRFLPEEINVFKEALKAQRNQPHGTPRKEAAA